MMFVCRACAVLCCAVTSRCYHFCVNLLRLLLRNRSVLAPPPLLPHDLPPPFHPSEDSEGATRCWKANLGDCHIVSCQPHAALAFSPVFVLNIAGPIEPCQHSARRPGVRPKRGFGIWCSCEVRGCSGAKLFQVVQVCREVWEGGRRGREGGGGRGGWV